MEDLAHWIINIGTGAMIGICILSVGYLFVRLAESLPNRVPVMTPSWEAIKDAIRKPADWLDRKISR